MTVVPTTTAEALLERYDAFFLDAYGVLVHDSGAIEGADRWLAALEERNATYFVLTNDASRSPADCAARYAKYGLEIDAERVISSGSLVASYFREHGLDRPRAIVLGSEAAVRHVEAMGAEVVEASPTVEFDVLLACGTRGYDFVELVDDAMSAAFRRIDRGEPLHLLLPNPDVIYPRSEEAFGFTAGGIAHLIEAALAVRFPDDAPRFTRLGKPYAPIFEAALERAGTRNALMVGDQLGTDIAGACGVGIDSALVPTGVATQGVDGGKIPVDRRPTWILPSLSV